MMYIEQAPLAGNLLKILKNRASLGNDDTAPNEAERLTKSEEGTATTANNNINSNCTTTSSTIAAVATAAYKTKFVNGDRDRPIVNGNGGNCQLYKPLEAIRQRIIRELQQSEKNNLAPSTQGAVLTESAAGAFATAATASASTNHSGGEEEEQYELFDIFDDTEEQKNFKNQNQSDKASLFNEVVIEIDNPDSFVEEKQPKYTISQDEEDYDLGDSDDQEFQVRLIKVPKRKLINQSKVLNGQDFVRSKRRSRPLTPELPIEYFDPNLYNSRQKLNHYRAPLVLNGYPPLPFGSSYDLNYQSEEEDNFNDEDDDVTTYSYYESGFVDHTFGDFYPHDDQMGIDIFGGLRQIFNWRPKIGSSSNRKTEASDIENGKRKRRSENWPTEAVAPHQFKYRKVESNFPKIITHALDDDVDGFVSYPTPLSARQRNLAEGTEYSTLNSNSYEMTQRGPDGSRSSQRRSWFQTPPSTRKIVRNTTYADLEFSDDENEDTLRLKHSLLSNIQNQPKVVNIPIRKEQQQHQHFSSAHMHYGLPKATAAASPAPFVNMKRGIGLTSQMTKPSYADALKFTIPFGAGNGQILGGNCGSSNASSLGKASASIFGNILGSSSRISSKTLGHSILRQEREKEEHEKYKLLLQALTTPATSTKPAPTQVNRSKISQATDFGATTKKSRLLSKYALSAASSQQRNHRVPLSSTINVDDDEEGNFGDITIASVTHLPSAKSKRKPETAPLSTIDLDEDDDDDISEIIDLGKDLSKRKASTIIDLESKENKADDLPYVQPVNSLRDKLSTIPHFKDDWFSSFDSRWEERRKLREAEVNKTLEITDKLTAERRAAESDLQERLRDFRIVDPELLIIDDFEEPEEEEEPALPELTPEHQARIKAAICGPPDQVLVEKFNMSITRRDIHTLLGHNWLNDEVINFYMNLLTERSEKKHGSHGYPTVYAMNTFFVQRLLQNGHGGVKRWTRKINIFEKDVIPVPVHVGGVHWCMAIIHLKNRWIRYYDSMGSPNPNVLKALEQYLKDESMDKKKVPFDTSAFEIESVRDVPRQMNGSDCGVFSCMFAEFITRNKEITFSQEHMEYFRHKMILEIVQGELLL